jgi:hypothetical protein
MFGFMLIFFMCVKATALCALHFSHLNHLYMELKTISNLVQHRIIPSNTINRLNWRKTLSFLTRNGTATCIYNCESFCVVILSSSIPLNLTVEEELVLVLTYS